MDLSSVNSGFEISIVKNLKMSFQIHNIIIFFIWTKSSKPTSSCVVILYIYIYIYMYILYIYIAIYTCDVLQIP